MRGGHREGKGRRVEGGKGARASQGTGGRARQRRGAWRGVRNPLQSRRRRGRGGARRGSGRRGWTAQGGDGDGGSRLLHRGCRSIFALLSPSRLFSAPPRPAGGRAGSLQGLPAPRRAFEEPRGWSRGCAGARPGGGQGVCRVPGRNRAGAIRARPGQHPPGQMSAPGTAGGGAHAHTRGHKDPGAHAPPCGSLLPRCPGCTRTLHLHTPRAHGHARTLGGVRAGPRLPGGPRARVHTLAHTHRAAPATRHTAHPPSAPTASRGFHADAGSVRAQDARPLDSRRRPRAGGVRPARPAAPCAPLPAGEFRQRPALLPA